MKLTTSEKQQYQRHLTLKEIGVEGQLKLKKAKVLVVGAGGLGCPILQYLTAAGVGTIGIIDDDVVAQSNLQRQLLYSTDDIGVAKVTAAIKRLSDLNPFVTFIPYKERLSIVNALTYFEKFDLIVDGSDNFQTRYLCNDAAILTKKPLVFGAIYKFEGQVSVFNYKKGPTYRCLYPSAPKPSEAPSCSEIGVLGVLPGIIGSIQATEAIKILCGIGKVLSGSLLTFDALTMQQMIIKIERTTEAEVLKLERDYDFFCGVKTDLLEITKEALALDRDSYALLDVREDNERLLFHIGGQHIPLSSLSKRIGEVYQDKPLVVYCKSGIRSGRAIEILKENQVRCTLLNLKGGC